MAGSGRFAMQEIFQRWDEAQQKNLSFVPRSTMTVFEAVSRVKMNAKVRRP